MVYLAQTWDAFGLTVFHAIAPTDTGLNVLYLYSAADTLQTIWHESYTHPLDYETASGAATYEGQLVSSTPELQCLDSVPSEEQLVVGVTITGAQLNWSAGSGSIEIDQQIYELYPFQLVDCSDCGTTEDDGWYELHAVFRGQHGEIEFGILYLFLEEPERVTLHYRIQLCDLRLSPSATYEANWVLEEPALKVRFLPLRSLEKIFHGRTQWFPSSDPRSRSNLH